MPVIVHWFGTVWLHLKQAVSDISVVHVGVRPRMILPLNASSSGAVRLVADFRLVPVVSDTAIVLEICNAWRVANMTTFGACDAGCEM